MPVRRWPSLLVSLLLLASGAAQADTAPIRPLDLSDLGTPAFTVFSARDGVPDEAIVAIEVDARGFAWLGSASTLARFDGASWQTDAPSGSKSLVRDLYRDRSGTLWATFDARGIAHHDGHRWQLENLATGLPTEHLFRMGETVDEDGRNTLWAGTVDAGLLRRVDGVWQSDPGNAQLPAGPIIGLAQTRRLSGAPRQWLGIANGGVWFRHPGGDWQAFDEPGFEVAQVTDLMVTEVDGQESLWISTFGSGLWRFNADGLRSWSAARGELASDQIYSARAMQLDRGDQVIWLASRAGVMRLHGDSMQIYDRRHGLPSDAVRGLEVSRSPDGAEILWLATEGGVARAVVNASPWQTVSLMGAGGNGVFNVLLEPDGHGSERLWVAATRDGLGLLENGRWRYFTQANGHLPDTDVRMVNRVVDDKGVATLFIGTAGGALLRVDDALRFTPIDTPWKRSPGEAALQVLGRDTDHGRELWFATRRSGIYRLYRGEWQQFRAQGSSQPWAVIKLVEQTDRSGRSWLWASTNQGLARFDGHDWTLVQTNGGMPDTDLIGMSMFSEPDGQKVLWIGSARHGVLRIDVTDPLAPIRLPDGDLPEAPDPTVYSALRDSQGRIYVCTNNGVQMLLPLEKGGYRERVFRRRDGLVHEECNTNAQMIDAHDRYWLGTLGGLGVYDPDVRALAQQSPQRALYLTEVSLDGAGIDADDHSVLVPVGARELRIGFALVSWQREDETRYRTQLLDFDPAPGAWTNQNFRMLGGLPPGRYTLRVEGRDFGGSRAPPLDISIEVLPAWWQRGLVQILAAVLLLLAVWAGVQWRLRALQAQRHRLRQEVAERTAELDAANRSLTELSYRDPLTGLANRRSMMNRLRQSWDRALSQRTPMAVIVVDIDHFKAFNDRHGHLAGDHALRAVAEAMRAAAGLDVEVARYGGEEFACMLDDATVIDAQRVAERMRRAVAELRLVDENGNGSTLSLSAGVAGGLPRKEDNPEEFLRQADTALYRAKHEGRNRVCVTESCAAAVDLL
jgi:diguanylate cyclase (GGDEF)-like protein